MLLTIRTTDCYDFTTRPIQGPARCTFYFDADQRLKHFDYTWNSLERMRNHTRTNDIRKTGVWSLSFMSAICMGFGTAYMDKDPSAKVPAKSPSLPEFDS